jgi:transposase
MSRAPSERFLLVHGERVVRVATTLMAGERRGGRDRGKSDLIDAMAVGRAALREGVDRLPVAELAGVELDIRARGRASASAAEYLA